MLTGSRPSRESLDLDLQRAIQSRLILGIGLRTIEIGLAATVADEDQALAIGSPDDVVITPGITIGASTKNAASITANSTSSTRSGCFE